MNALDHCPAAARRPAPRRLPPPPGCLEYSTASTAVIAVELPDVRLRAGHARSSPPARARPCRLRRVLARGDIGFGETWMDGLWETEDLPGLPPALGNRACGA